MSEATLIIVAAALVVLAGVFAMTDAAISGVSPARAAELEPGGRPDAPEPGPSMLGDIVLCPDFAAKQADKAGHSLGHELALLTVHGVLHLLGYDHAEPDEEKEMFALQGQLLEEWVADQVEAYHQDRQKDRDRQLLDKSRYFDEP